jgi:hypothetical protein
MHDTTTASPEDSTSQDDTPAQRDPAIADKAEPAQERPRRLRWPNTLPDPKDWVL